LIDAIIGTLSAWDLRIAVVAVVTVCTLGHIPGTISIEIKALVHLTIAVVVFAVTDLVSTWKNPVIQVVAVHRSEVTIAVAILVNYGLSGRVFGSTII